VVSLIIVVAAEQAIWPPSIRLGLFLGLVASVLYGIPANTTLGLAIHEFLVEAKRTNVSDYIAAGCVVGIFVVSVLSLLAGSFYDWLVLPGLVGGGLTALVFWLIRRPDRDSTDTT
jgi:hypothetical protein